MLDFVHPDDLDKVKDHLSTQENSSNNTTGRILDLKTGTVKKEGHPSILTLLLLLSIYYFIFNLYIICIIILFRLHPQPHRHPTLLRVSHASRPHKLCHSTANQLNTNNRTGSSSHFLDVLCAKTKQAHHMSTVSERYC